jgi:phosphatidate cytidylyltransferase
VQFSCLIAVFALIGLYEYCRMAFSDRKLETTLAILAAIPICLAVWSRELMPLLAVMTCALLFFSIIFLFRIKDIRESAGDSALLFFGLLYVPFLVSHLGLLRMLPHGIEWIFLLLVIVMAGDTGAYYVGSTVGKRKLYPVVSPNKSIEGSLGGLMGSMVGAFIAKATFFPALSIFDCVATSILLGGLGQLGDLFESMLKRSFGVKDSGRIFPGHGGMLDRLDSILFAAPAAFLYANYIYSHISP